MKKIIVVFLLCAMLMPMLMSVGAVGEDNVPMPTADEIIRMSFMADALVSTYAGLNSQDKFNVSVLKTDPNDTSIIYSATPGMPNLVYERSLEYFMYRFFLQNFTIEHERAISTREELITALCDVYTADVASSIVDKLETELMTVRIKQGNLYINNDLSDFDAEYLYGYRADRFLCAKNIKVNGKSASADLVVSLGKGVSSIIGYMSLPVTLEYTDGGWRLCEDIVFSMIYSSSADSYRIDEALYGQLFTPELSGDTLTDEQITWLVEQSNEAFLSLISCYKAHASLLATTLYSTSISAHGAAILPYKETELPIYIREVVYTEVMGVYLKSRYAVDAVPIDTPDEATFYECLSGFFCTNAMQDFVSYLRDEIYSLYLKDGKVYIPRELDRWDVDTPLVYKVSNVKSITYSGDGAVAEVELLIKPNMSLEFERTVISVELKKTENGWRMAENIYGSKLYVGIENEKPDGYRDPYPDVCPLPNLNGKLTAEAAALLTERAFQVYMLFNHRQIKYIKTPDGDGPFGLYECMRINESLPTALLGYDLDVAEEYYDYRYLVSPDREYDFLGVKLRDLDDVNALLDGFLCDALALRYKRSISGENGPVDIFVEDDLGRLRQLSAYSGPNERYLISFGDFRVNGNTALLEVVMGTTVNVSEYDKDYEDGVQKVNATVTFEKTKDGWRISGGTMFSLLYGDSYTEGSPSTSDVTPTVVFVAFVSLAVCGYTAVKKRRV